MPIDATQRRVFLRVTAQGVIDGCVEVYRSDDPSPGVLVEAIGFVGDTGNLLGRTYQGGMIGTPPPTPPASTVLTKYQFRQRLTLAEQVAIDNTDTAQLPGTVKAYVRTINRMFDAASEVDLRDPATLWAVGYLEQAGLVAMGRAAQITALAPGGAIS